MPVIVPGYRVGDSSFRNLYIHYSRLRFKCQQPTLTPWSLYGKIVALLWLVANLTTTVISGGYGELVVIFTKVLENHIYSVYSQYHTLHM